MMTDEEFVKKLKKMAFFEHTGAQKEILWKRLSSYIGTEEVGVSFWHFSFRFVYLVAVVLIVLLGSASVTFASQSSLPGQPLYPVKRLSEEAKIFVIFDQKAKKKERIKLTTRRVDEVDKLIAQDPEKAEQVLEEYEEQMQGLEQEFSEDPELVESFNETLSMNKDVFVKVVESESTPDQIKTRIRVLIEEEPKSEEGSGEVEGEQTPPPETESTGDNQSEENPSSQNKP